MKNKTLILYLLAYCLLIGLVIHATLVGMPFLISLLLLALTGLLCGYIVAKVTQTNGDDEKE